MLIGDLVQDVREAVTDQPQTLPPPFQTALPTLSLIASANPLAQVPYTFTFTSTNNWGESQPSGEVTITPGPGQAIQISGGFFPGPGVGLRGYVAVGGGPGTETNYFIIPVINGVASLPFIFDLSLPTLVAAPPSRNTAYLPDTNGDAISAGTLFRWINRALELASETVGGLLDYSGISTVSGVPQYIAPGLWSKISTLWYDGYPLAMDDAGTFFRRNTITASILASVGTSLLTDRMMLEVWPQPSRTAAQTTLAQALTATATQAVLTSMQGFLLTDGMANINGEIVSYNGISGTTLKGLIRGLSGTTPTAQVAGAQVNELNMFWQGFRRYAPAFKPGDSMLSIPVPVGWNAHIFKYVLGRAKLAEQNVGDFSKLEESLVKSLSDWQRANKVTTGPRQVGEQTNSLEVMNNMGGGFVIP